ncbi:hypothetical protein ANANG_G00020770 [Anguilla anguilla]|uniref:Uncharacterized protein n=1 Tax=Anguilla anguilla TaxID=7936 RepID=A0A9D3S7D5_ANGAN|nr:hypothetical protein ANANG_G00020770 [Anguilla anguilla]
MPLFLCPAGSLAAQNTAPLRHRPGPRPRAPQPARGRPTRPAEPGPRQGGPALAPKPPPSTREGLVRKTATQRLSRQCSSEARGGGAGSNAQHVVYEAVCGKAGLSLYSKLFQSYGSKNR